jgi:hypothetical protein
MISIKQVFYHPSHDRVDQLGSKARHACLKFREYLLELDTPDIALQNLMFAALKFCDGVFVTREGFALPTQTF